MMEISTEQSKEIMMSARFYVLAGLLIMALMAGISATAQEGKQENTCNKEQWEEFSPYLLERAEALTTEDDPLLVLFQIEMLIESVRANCTGGVWTSADYGEHEVVIGPVSFSGTLYQATLKTPGSAIVKMTTLEGKCDESETIILASDLDSDEVEETSVVYEFKDCVALFEVDGIGSPWSLDVVKLR